jgi:thiosulfate/3-mercaptopyruvate sulfurtransferase
MRPLITPEEIKGIRGEIVYIDTRDPVLYGEGHIPGAVNIRDIFTRVSVSSEEALLALRGNFIDLFSRAGLSGREHAIVYEDALDTGNGQSCRGYFLLKYLGYKNVSVLDGGFKSWVAHEFPVTQAEEIVLPSIFPVQVDPSILLTQNHIKEFINLQNAVLLDVRDEPEWCGLKSSPSGNDLTVPCGRIPGAVWIEWREFIDCNKSPAVFKSKEEIIAICAQRGIASSSNVYIYCFKGSRAASTYVALESAGFNKIKNYFSSWAEWASDASNPIDQSVLLNQL